jgi:hypothetical protein
MPHREAASREHKPSVTLRDSDRDPCPHQSPGSRRQIQPLDRTQIIARIPDMGALGHPRLGDETAKRDLKRTLGAHPENGSTGRFQATGSSSDTPPRKTNTEAMPLHDG